MAKKKSESKPAKVGKEAKSPQVALAPHADGAPGINIGISSGDRRKTSDGLAHFLSDAFTLYLKTHNFHWNVTGQMFNALHNMFEAQYTEQWNALDEIAERIRALGFNAPGSYAEFIRLSSIAEEPGLTDAADWREMVRQLVVGNEAVC
ncbi:MAG: DNA starvation/stationary phase protection protein, partial [Pseudomonadota bacterium]|nr:DNA starvation/stationary phase protection protein [Pseudomonadota bacterium]